MILFFITAGESIITILLERGAFNKSDTIRVYDIILVYAFIMIPLNIQSAIDQVFQVEKKFSYIVKIKIFGLLSNFFMNYMLIFVLNLGVVGAALSTTISYWLVLILSLLNIKNADLSISWKNHC